MGTFSGLRQVLRRRRIELCMTQAQLAAAAGIGKASVTNFESGRSRPRLDTLEKIFGALAIEAPGLLSIYIQGNPIRGRLMQRYGQRRERPKLIGASPETAIRGVRLFLESISRLVEEFGES